MKTKKEVEAIHKHDLEELLKNLGLLGDLRAGKVRCQFCSDVVKEDGFGAIYSQQHKILFSCSKLECLAKLPKE